MPGGFKITTKSWWDLGEDEVAAGLDLGNLLSREVLPDDPDTPIEQVLAARAATPKRIVRWSVRAYDDDTGALIGSTGLGYDPDHDDNPDMCFTGVEVHPDHRRRGVGTALLRELVGMARADGRLRFVGSTNERVPAGEAFTRTLGATSKQADHINHLVLADVDRPMLERWVADGPTRASAYELVAIDGRIPDDLADAYVDLVLVMNTAPRDDLQMNDFTFTVDELREGDQRRDAIGGGTWTLIARRVEDGALAGFHDLSWSPDKPSVMWVESTGVRTEHRGHALGKWLKAAMTLRVLDERPQVTEIRTGNADSNDAMLGINRAMGYEPYISQTTWELSLDDAEAWLATRP